MKIFSLLCTAICFSVLSVQGCWALSDAEYKVLMKDPAFSASDKKLNEAWKKARAKMTVEDFEALKKGQKQWLAKERDKGAGVNIDSADKDQTRARAKAYAQANSERTAVIVHLTEASQLKQNAAGVQGFYDLGSIEREKGTLEVYGTSGRLRVAVDRELEINPGNWRVGMLNGHGTLKGSTVTVVDDNNSNGRMTVKFDGEKAIVTTTDEFKRSGWCGMPVILDGTYTRVRAQKK